MKGRGEKAIINTASAMLMELVAIICGLILPRLIMGRFGSAYNGLTGSVSNFLSCAVLLRSGIGGATRAALYKPIKEGNRDEINAIMSATNIFMKKIALILGGAIIGFAFIYPFFVMKEFDWLFSFTLFLIMGIETFFTSLLGITNYILLQADQRNYVPALAHTISYILNTVIAVILIENGFGIHAVKLGSAFAFTLYPVMLAIYVRKKYKIDFSVAPDNKAIAQRWDAFFHQVAAFVMNNTDVIVLTIFSNTLVVSVYTTYNYVFAAIKKMIKSFTDGLEAAFGSMIADGDQKKLSENFFVVESLIFDISTFINTCCGLLIVEFVMVYTRGVTDISYSRPLFALVMVLGKFFDAVRMPYQLVVQAAGHYKQTKIGAIIEPIINITISVLVVIWFGLVGVAVGTLCAIVFRTIQYAMYVNKHLVKGCLLSLIKNCLMAAAEYVIVMLIYNALPLTEAKNYGIWFLHGIIVAVMAAIVIVVFTFIFRNKQFMGLVEQLKTMVNRRLKKAKKKAKN